MMLRPTESPIVFLQQLGRGLRTSVDKDALTVIDFIGNHRSFLLKPRTLLSLTTSTAPTTLQVLQAIRDGDFDLPDGCSVDYELEVVDMFTRLAKFNSRDAIEDYCRSYFEEEGLRPTATQALRAGHDPAIVRPRFRGWFEFLDSIKLLTSSESAVRDEQRNVLSKLETEPINKSHKLVALRALLHDGRLRSGDEIAHNAETSRRLILADPRLERDVPAREFPELAESNPEKWAAYWLKWPLKHMASEGEAQRADPLFRIADDRIVPTYAVSSELALVFDAMAAEIIEYRLAHYLASKATETETWSCNLTIADGLPVVRLDRRQSPDLPTGTILFEADGEQYSGEFDRGALVNAAPTVGPGNTLADLLRSWFGPRQGIREPVTSSSSSTHAMDIPCGRRHSRPIKKLTMCHCLPVSTWRAVETLTQSTGNIRHRNYPCAADPANSSIRRAISCASPTPTARSQPSNAVTLCSSNGSTMEPNVTTWVHLC